MVLQHHSIDKYESLFKVALPSLQELPSSRASSSPHCHAPKVQTPIAESPLRDVKPPICALQAASGLTAPLSQNVMPPANRTPKGMSLALRPRPWLNATPRPVPLRWWCQTNANQSQFSCNSNLLGSKEIAPLGKCCGAVLLEIQSA